MAFHEIDFFLSYHSHSGSKKHSPYYPIINPTLVHQLSKTSNLLISNSLLDIRSQTIHKLQTIRSFSIHSIVIRIILNQLLKSYSIFNHGSITLLQLKEFHLFLTTHIFWKIVLQECIT